jgi:hypothetical protein
MTDRINALETPRQIVSRANLFFLLQMLAGEMHAIERNALSELSIPNEPIETSMGRNGIAL